MYNTRSGMTNVPNLLRNVPRNRIQAGRGSARKLAKRPGELVSMWKIKNPACSRQAGLKVLVNSLSFSLLPIRELFLGHAPADAALARNTGNRRAEHQAVI